MSERKRVNWNRFWFWLCSGLAVLCGLATVAIVVALIVDFQWFGLFPLATFSMTTFTFRVQARTFLVIDKTDRTIAETQRILDSIPKP